MPKITLIYYRTLIRIFEQEGFTAKRQKGDHIIMTKPGAHCPVVITTSPRKVPVTHIHTNLTTASIAYTPWI
ncbi:MAG: hypothetical protein B6I38_09865 [Anaerolineaceae bacterium 4572_5.1]|nr:MAG: hypothetical protein B6I38_09865 [Anaerolineaceae bacterium 4572_5.1]